MAGFQYLKVIFSWSWSLSSARFRLKLELYLQLYLFEGLLQAFGCLVLCWWCLLGCLRGGTLLEEWSHWGNFWGFVVSPQFFLSASCLWFKILFICILCVWVFYMHICKCALCVQCPQRTDLPELELQIFSSCYFGAENKSRSSGNIISVINNLAISSLLAPTSLSSHQDYWWWPYLLAMMGS